MKKPIKRKPKHRVPRIKVVASLNGIVRTDATFKLSAFRRIPGVKK